MAERERANIKWEIIKRFGVLSTYPTGWSKEFNLVRWNDNVEKYDIRDWSPGHDRMSKGVTLYADEVEALMDLCGEVFGNKKSAAAQPKSQPVSNEAPPESTETVKATAATEGQNAVADAAQSAGNDGSDETKQRDSQMVVIDTSQQASQVAEEVPF